MEITHHRKALDDPLSGELEHQAEDTVRRRMLRTHVENELLDLALFDLDRREGVVGRVLDSPPRGLGGGYSYPPFMI
jgi:hypothetical protein